MWLYTEAVNYVKWLLLNPANELSSEQIPPERPEDKPLQPTDVGSIPGPFSVPIFGASWLYTALGRYTHDQYHESSFDKFKRYVGIRQHL